MPDSLAASTFARISAGFYHNCGILDGQNDQAEGTVRCWGRNEAMLLQSTVPAGWWTPPSPMSPPGCTTAVA